MPTTVPEAVSILENLTKGFYVLGALLALFGLYLGPAEVLDGLGYAALGWALKRYRARSVAVVVAVLSGMGLIQTAYNQFSGGSGGRNIFMAIILIACALHACRVTFAYHRLLGSAINVGNVIVRSLVATVYAILAFVVVFVIAATLRVDLGHPSENVSLVFMETMAIAVGTSFAGVVPFTRGRPLTSSRGVEPS